MNFNSSLNYICIILYIVKWTHMYNGQDKNMCECINIIFYKMHNTIILFNIMQLIILMNSPKMKLFPYEYGICDGVPIRLYIDDN